MKKITFSKIAFFTLLLGSSSAVNSQLLQEGFEGGTFPPSGWTTIDADGGVDINNWSSLDIATYSGDTYLAHSGTLGAASRSWDNTNGSYAPDNWLITPQLNIVDAGTILKFYGLGTWGTASGATGDHLGVFVSTTGTAEADFVSINERDFAAQSWEEVSLSLAAFVGQNIYIAFRHYNCSDQEVIILDDIEVKVPMADDATLVSSTLNRYSLINTNNTLALSVKNNGSNPITSLTVNWNDGMDHSSVITTNIAVGETVSIDHPSAITYPTALEKTIAITITNVNGNIDPNSADNNGGKDFNTLSVAQYKNPLIEQATGTWCGWCPRGKVGMDYMFNHYADFAGVAVHNADPMVVDEYDAAIGAYIGGYPSAVIDREYEEDPNQATLESIYTARKLMLTPALVEGTATIAGSTVSINASATFRTIISKEMRLGLIIVEDSLSGTTAEWSQANYYGANAIDLIDEHGTNWKNLPNPVPAADMVYNHVGVALVGGFTGQTGSVPATINDGTTANYTFNYTVPATSRVNNMHGIIVLINQETGHVVNTVNVDFPEVGAGLFDNTKVNFNVYPNPSIDEVNVEFDATNSKYDVTVYDANGKVVKSASYNNLSGLTNIKIDLSDLKSGNYLIGLSTNGESFTQNVVKK